MRRRCEHALGLIVALAAAVACRQGKKTTAQDLELTEQYTVKSGLAVVHHPRVLVATQVNESVARLAPAAYGPFGIGDEIFVSTTKSPATAQLDEYVRVVHEPFEADMKGWTETSRKATPCLGVYSGMELTASFVAKDGKKRRYWSCTFLHATHGYKVSYAVDESAATADAPLLRKVIDATEIRGAP
jgi:hypothetical protein